MEKYKKYTLLTLLLIGGSLFLSGGDYEKIGIWMFVIVFYNLFVELINKEK